MRKTRTSRRLGALALLCALLASLCLAPFSAAAEEAEKPTPLQQARERYEQLQAEYEAIGEEIERNQNNKAAAEEQLATLQREQEIIKEMIVVNQQEIDATQADMDAKQDEIAKVRGDIYLNDLNYRKRLVAIYEMNNASVLSQILSIESFTEFFQVVDSMQRISVNDTELLTRLAQQKSELQAQEAQIQQEIDTLFAYHEELGANNLALENNQAAQRDLIAQAESLEGQLEEQQEDAYAAMVQAQKEMVAIQNQAALTGSRQGDGSQYVGGAFTWPVPGFYNITCYFGSPDPNGAAHRGMDISGGGVLGAPIVACNTGTVIIAQYAHGSYGNYIVLDHGDGIKTLYAHCTALTRGVGETVGRGEQIATVGSTGFSTGPHLHLEVQTGGGLQNPLNYLQ